MKRTLTLTSLLVNAMALIAFSILAILYKQAHPEIAYTQSVSTILLLHNFINMFFQATIAILLLVGFESITSLGAEALRPKQDM